MRYQYGLKRGGWQCLLTDRSHVAA
ncbi:hypothetical protein PLANTIT3_110055 [Plantibacter sp. T3]|nr:hypothetical protein PLANTIT3_110055 [Plantibacter sp. T3]